MIRPSVLESITDIAMGCAREGWWVWMHSFRVCLAPILSRTKLISQPSIAVPPDLAQYARSMRIEAQCAGMCICRALQCRHIRLNLIVKLSAKIELYNEIIDGRVHGAVYHCQYGVQTDGSIIASIRQSSLD